MKLPGFGGMSFKQLRMAKRAMHIMKATALSAMDPVKAAHLGMKVVDKAITTGVKAGKEGGFLRGLAEGAKSLGTGSLLGMSKMTKKPKLTFDEAYEVYKTGVEADHASYAKAATRAADVAKQMTAAGFKPKRMRLPKPPARLLLKHEWAPKKVEGVDYGGPAPTWDLDALKKDHPDTWEHLAPKRVFRGTHKFLMGKKGWASPWAPKASERSRPTRPAWVRARSGGLRGSRGSWKRGGRSSSCTSTSR